MAPQGKPVNSESRTNSASVQRAAQSKQASKAPFCIEDLFGQELAARFTQSKEPAPTVLLNMSNIAWFGNSSALGQHLNISRMRSLELQRPMLRATNTGATAHINFKGQVSAVLPYLSRAVLQVEVEGRKGLTPYAFWAGRFGLAPLWIFCLLIYCLAICYSVYLRRLQNQSF